MRLKNKLQVQKDFFFYGISIRFLYEDIESVKNILTQNNIECKGIYKITRLENGTKEVENIG